MSVSFVRFSHCSQLEEHVRDNHDKCDAKNIISVENQQILCSTETNLKYSCDLCHKTFNEKRKLLTHTTRCEKRHKNSISDGIDCENVRNYKKILILFKLFNLNPFLLVFRLVLNVNL